MRLLPLERAAGPHLMAGDEVLLEAAVAGTASLRFYTWSQPTLSLGYFQSATRRLENPRLAALSYVRRLSGGDALVHHHELTYCLALPADKNWQGAEPWPSRMHRIIVTALEQLGVPATRACQVAAPAFTGGSGPMGVRAGEAATGAMKGQGPVSHAQGRFTIVTVALTASDYPARSDRGTPIDGLGEAAATGALVFHASTELADGKLVTNGGRVLNVTGVGATLEEAGTVAYAGAGALTTRAGSSSCGGSSSSVWYWHGFDSRANNFANKRRCRRRCLSRRSVRPC